MELTPKGEIVKGYKATDHDMKCRGFQFGIGVWYEHEGEVKQCESGFHFCEYPSGPWSYYNSGRLFKCEAEFVLKSSGPGSDIKHVAKRIRLISEIEMKGDRNTGDWNTGDGNTGNRNIGSYNSGFFNIGDAPLVVFGKKTCRESFPYSLAEKLSVKLSSDDEFDPNPYLSIPNATIKKIKDLHIAFINKRKEVMLMK